MSHIDISLLPLQHLRQIKNIAELCRDKTAVLLGESTHGTREFYDYRSQLTKHLLPLGFRYVFFEADWEVIRPLNQYIHGQKSLTTCLRAMNRVDKYPIWMVKNKSMCDMLSWMRNYNLKNGYRDLGEGVVFMGLDCYDMKYSWRTLQDFFRQNKSPPSFDQLEQFFSGTKGFINDTQNYGKQMAQDHQVATLLISLRQHLLRRFLSPGHHYSWQELEALQAVQSLMGADRYFRNLYQEPKTSLESQSWTYRDRHWLEMIRNVAEYQQATPKEAPFRFVLWAHNSHIGDSSGEVSQQYYNIGEFVRQHFTRKQTVLIGFTTYGGKVRASGAWDSSSRIYRIAKPAIDTYSHQFHQFTKAYGNQFAVLLNKKLKSRYLTLKKTSPKLPALHHTYIVDKHHQRSIGVIYRPKQERVSHYSQGNIQESFDMIIHLDQTHALTLL